MKSFEVRSPEMSRGEPLLSSYAHDKAGGRNLSPPLFIEAVPSEARSLALAMVDRDADDFLHWAVVDLPAGDIRLDAGASGTSLPEPARELYNTHSTRGYFGPSPPPRGGAHKYELIVYALDEPTLDVDEHADAASFMAAAEEHALSTGSTYWMYENR